MEHTCKVTLLTTIKMMVVSFSLFSVPQTKIIPLDSSFYEDMEVLYLVSGYRTPSNKAPWSVAEAQVILLSIDVDKLPSKMRDFFK